jgi:DnaJ-class molecular chaperone
MGWLTGKPKTERKPATCGTCQGRGRLPRFGLAPGGQVVQVDTRPCGDCNGRGRV